MKSISRYGIFIFLVLCTSCACKKQKKLDKRVSLWRLDRIPYGTKYAYDNLPFLFPNADIRTSSQYPGLYQEETDDTTRALIIVSPKFVADSDEMEDIIRFAASGNQVFISSGYFDDSVLDKLHLKINEKFYPGEDSSEVSLMDPGTKEWVKFDYPGYSSDAYFETIDTTFAVILGRDHRGRPDFIRIPYPRGGSIFIHLNPFVFTNFFLLHKGNKYYYDIAFSYVPAKTGVVEWSDYFRYSRKTEQFSTLRFIFSSRSLRWAFWLMILLFLILFLIESKRKQRAISEIPALRNASVDFVKTVGRLYFQQKNNQNLAAKMVTGLLENIRSAYNLPTTTLDNEFVHKLAFRTGRPVNEIEELIRLIHESRLKTDFSDQELMELHLQINQFNKPA